MDATSNYTYHVLESLQREPDRNILVVGDESITCKEFHKRVSYVAKLLKETVGLKPGERVLFTSAPSVDFYCIVCAVFSVGGTFVVLDTAMGFERVDYCIRNANPAVWIWPKGSKMKWTRFIFPSIRNIPKHVEVGPTQGEVELLQPEDVIPVENCLVTFTTGSTGMPKLLLREHSFLSKQSKCLSMTYHNIAKDSDINVDERDFGVATNLYIVPLHFLKLGALCVVIDKFVTCDPAAVIKTLKKYKVSGIVSSPALAYRLSQYAVQHKIMLPIISIAVGGAPVFRGALRVMANAVPDKKVTVIYGSTEAEPISTISAKKKMKLEENKPDGLCVGLPAVENSVKIISILDESPKQPLDIRKLELPRGDIGELVISGWHVNTHEVEQKRLIYDNDGTVWLRIEDAGFMDTSGRIWLVGRVKWRVIDPVTGISYWSTVVEQKIMERTSLITFVVYLKHNNKAYLFIEAPNGLPPKENEGLEQFIKTEGIPVDELVIKSHIKKDRRHASKPDTRALFSSSKDISGNATLRNVLFVLSHNPIILCIFVIIFLLIFACFYFIFNSYLKL